MKCRGGGEGLLVEGGARGLYESTLNTLKSRGGGEGLLAREEA